MLPKRNRAAPLALAWGALILIAGCSTGTDGEMTESAAAPANEKTAAPSASSTPATESSAEPTTAALTLFYVAVGDEGKSGPKIGCGDSLVSAETGPEEFTNQVEAAITALLADDKEELGGSGLRNALAGSDLSYASSVVDGDVVTVELNGTVSSGGTCDDPRIIGQLKYTAMTAAGTGEAEILVEGEKIEKVLSAK
ncbi:GerMN domain-containing protein [Glutamicibacter arilaitensis]|uniref:GerMN domain-containing protein n=1 Tax=Glutamicibacter arilaitensis TaxID=256701 RepID=UPI001D01D6A9|nr:GerMN domain-containing protein [Glutamicibacter arilaitensis]